MKKLFVGFSNFFYTRDTKKFNETFAIKENKVSIFIVILPSVIISVCLIIIFFTKSGYTFILSKEDSAVMTLVISTIFLIISSFVFNKIYNSIVNKDKFIYLDDETYKKYSTYNIMFTFGPLLLLILVIFLLF